MIQGALSVSSERVGGCLLDICKRFAGAALIWLVAYGGRSGISGEGEVTELGGDLFLFRSGGRGSGALACRVLQRGHREESEWMVSYPFNNRYVGIGVIR